MAKNIVIDWQPDSLMFAHGTGRGERASLDKVFLQPIGDAAEGMAISLTEGVRKAATEVDGAKSSAVVIVSRELVELRTLAVPKVDPDELPDIIRLQAMRQFANISDSWALDYVMLPPAPGQEMQTALVAAISPQHVAQIESSCAASNIQIDHIALRPIEIARYALEAAKLSGAGGAMIVCISEGTAEFLILQGGKVLQVRGTNLPSERDEWPKILKGELRRSMMATSSMMGGAELTDVMLIAEESLAAVVRETVSEATGAAVNTLDPLSFMPAKIADSKDLATTASHRLAAIAGALSFASGDKQTHIDFKNPKKRLPKKQNTKLYILAGVAAAVVVLAAGSWYYTTSNQLDQDLAFYRGEVAAKEPLVEVANKKISELNQVKQFLAASPNWLDELTYISKRIPGADRIVFESPTFSSMRDGSGKILVPVRADESGSISLFESSLSDENHVVRSTESKELDQPAGIYKWRAVESIMIRGRGWNPIDDEVVVPQAGPEETADSAADFEAAMVAVEAADDSADVSPETADVPDAPDADTPDAETPDAETPDAETPDAETPDAENETLKPTEISPEADDSVKEETSSETNSQPAAETPSPEEAEQSTESEITT